MMKIWFNILAVGLTATVCSAADFDRSTQIVALKSRDTLFVRSGFNKKFDLVIRMSPGRKNKQLNLVNAGLTPVESQSDPESFKKVQIIHNTGDDVAPWLIHGTYIGANHGSAYVRRLIIPEHGLSTKDIGTALTGAKGGKFYICRINDGNTILVLGDAKKAWAFDRNIKTGDEVTSAAGKKLKLQKVIPYQLYPALRITNQKFLIDGKTELEDDKAVIGASLDAVDDYDIIDTRSALEQLKKAPGKDFNFIGPDLAVVLSQTITYHFQPMGAMTIRNNAEIKSDTWIRGAGFVQAGLFASRGIKSLKFYIPKTKPFEQKGQKFDFREMKEMIGFRPLSTMTISEKNGNLSNPESYPDRIVELAAYAGSPLPNYGFAMGYSLIEGDTMPQVRAKNCKNAFTISRSYKAYPNAIDRKTCHAGDKINTLCYRQYFDPANNPDATSVYGHYQGDSYVLYVDFHKNIDNGVIKLPAALTGKSISVIEKTPSVTLTSGDKVPETGITLQVKNNYGYAVYKIK
jgi:hypothetical protein